MTVVFLDEAQRDVDAGRDFYDECEFGVGEYFVNTIYEEANRIPKTAGAHRTVFDFHLCLSKVFPYGIYYRIDRETIQIGAVLDLRRNPKLIRNELSSRPPPKES